MIVRAIPSVDDLVNEHLSLVTMVVRTLRKMPCVKRLGDEAFSVGRFALFSVASRPRRLTRATFATYAERSISRAIIREARKNDKALGLHLVNPDALADDCHEAPVPEKRKRGRPKKKWNPWDAGRN